MIQKHLQPLVPGLWVAETKLRFLSMLFSARMTMVALPSGLWLHSPIPLGPVKAEIDRLGPVAWRVAPNLMHHLYQAPWQEAYPDSRLAGPAALARKRAGSSHRPGAGRAPWRPGMAQTRAMPSPAIRPCRKPSSCNGTAAP